MRTRKTNDSYKWVILVICFLMEFVCLGFCSSNAGLYKKAITDALGFDRTLFAVMYSIRHIVSAVAGLSFGFWVKKFGIRWMSAFGLSQLTLAVVIFSGAESLPMFYLGGVCWGLGMIFCGGTMASTIVRRWFDKDVGTYTGIVMCANGLGGALAAQIITPLINDGTAFGYRNAYRVAAVVTFVISVIIVSLLRDRKSDAPVGKAGKKLRGATWSGISYQEVAKKPYFYCVAALILLTGVSLTSVGSITLTYYQDLGMPAKLVGMVATVSSIALMGSKLFVGKAFDRWGLRVTLLICQIASLCSFLIKAFLTNSTAGHVMAFVAIIFGNLAVPLETVVIPLLTNELFGQKDYVKILGIFAAMNQIGLCIGSPLGELFYTFLGSYRPAMWMFGTVMVCIIFGYRAVMRAAYREKDRILAQQPVE